MAKIIIKEEVYDKVMHWIEKCDNEVAGFGKVEVLANGDFYITEAYLLEQEVGAAHADIDANALAKLMYEAREVPGQLRWWWHSHVEMAVFWSSTDTATIKELGGQGWIAATVFNKKHEYRSALCYQTEVTTPWGKAASLQLDDNITLEIETNRYTEETIKKWEDELTAKVRTRPIVRAPSWDSNVLLGGNVTPIPGVPTTYKKPYDFEADGLYGYGAKIEAEAVGISVKRYLTWLKDDNPHPSKDWKRIDEKLHQAWRDGTLDRLQDKYNNRGGL